jgi:metal-responsive CopG/Arc/MetJ family transcriptional regulator
MKVKTSVTLSQELLDAIDQTCGPAANRSEFFERVAWDALREQWRRERNARDLAIINAHADELNALTEEIMALQADP